jgi:hypothetical protein
MFGLIHKYKTRHPKAKAIHNIVYDPKWRIFVRVFAILSMLILITPFHIIVGAWTQLKENWPADLRTSLQIAFGKWIECDWSWRPIEKNGDKK